jgi:choline monooxygenase
MDLSDYRPTTDISSAQTLPARWYTDAALLDGEKEKIFWKTWQWVGRADQVRQAGDYFTAEVLGEPLIVLRDDAGQLRAYANVCRHRAGKVASGCGRARALRCAYHGWTYGLDGRLLGAREFDGARDWRKEDVRLPEMRAAEWGPFVFVSLDPAIAPLSQVLEPITAEVRSHGYDLSEFRFGVRKHYEIGCNWKVYIDNYQEGYHIPAAHPALFKELDYDQYRVDCFPGYSHHHAPIRRFEPGDPRIADRRYATGGEEKRTLYYWVFPNWMINIYPDNLSINLVLPLGADRTLTVFEWYFTEEKRQRGEKWLQEEASFSDIVQQEDIAICEAVQRGLRSRTYDRGRFSPSREQGVHHFHRLLYESLSAPV